MEKTMFRTISRPVFAVSFLLMATFLLSSTQQANAAVCSDRKKFTTYLSEKYKELPKAIGLVSNSGLMELYVSKKGTWSILMTSPNGIACLIAAGDHWEGFKLAQMDTPS